MAGKRVEPSTTSTSFNCAHCEAHAQQIWYDVYGGRLLNNGVPYKAPTDDATLLAEALMGPKSPNKIGYAQRVRSGELFIGEMFSEKVMLPLVGNLHASQCFVCGKLTIWVADRVLYPPVRRGAEPNANLPAEVRRDYEEARTIVDLSPRGAVALLRLSIQKLCKHLGESGENLNDDIASLVRRGLDEHVRQALDTVRVVGNHAVHPGVIDLRDDPDTATKLFELVNVIAEEMISRRQRIKGIYESVVPEKDRKNIDKRDKRDA